MPISALENFLGGLEQKVVSKKTFFFSNFHQKILTFQKLKNQDFETFKAIAHKVRVARP